MARRWFLLSLGFLLVVVGFIPQSVMADWEYVQVDYDGSFSIPAGNYYYIYALRDSGFKELIDFTCTAGANRDVDFFVCDSSNFDSFQNGYSFYTYISHERVVSWSGEFEFPYSDTWYFVFSNTFSVITTKTVELTLTLYEWQDTPTTPTTTPTTPNPYYGPVPFLTIGIGVAVLVIIIVVVILIAIIVTRRKAASGIPDSPKTESLTTSVPVKTHCTQCGAKLEGNETFCGSCGNQIKK